MEAKDLSIVIPAWNEGENLRLLLPQLSKALADLGLRYEVIVADHEATDDTASICTREGARLLMISGKGYGTSLREAFATAQGEYVLTMDADLSHPSEFIQDLWRKKGDYDVVIASRYIRGGSADMPLTRLVLSRILNGTFSIALQMPVQDLSSGFRLYRRAVLQETSPEGRDFNILQEILTKAVCRGFTVGEIPFSYQRRGSGSSHARLAAFAVEYLKTFRDMWSLRNSIYSGDYDMRAYNSRIPAQRWWQRRRHDIILGWAAGRGPALDIGCGSSKILEGLPEGSVGMDISLPSLRHARRWGKDLVAGSISAVPIADRAFSTVICSQVIEHVPRDDGIFTGFHRLLEPGGELILGTPDYGRLIWRITEALYHRIVPGGYAEEHITRYDAKELEEIVIKAGFSVLERKYIGGGELILRCRREDRECQDG